MIIFEPMQSQIKSIKNTTLLLITCIFAGIYTLLNYKFGYSDHIEQLPIIYKFLDATYLENDFFVNANSGYSPRFFYAKIITFFGNWFSVELIFLSLLLLSNILAIIITFKTAELLFKSKLIAFFAPIFLMFFTFPELGSIQKLLSISLVPSAIAFPLGFLAIYFTLKRKILWAILLCGFISIFHVLIGFELGLILLLVYFLTNFKADKFKDIKKYVGYGLLLILFLLVNLVPYFSQTSTINSDDFINIVAHFRHPHHYIPSSFLTLKELMKTSFWLLVLVISFKKLKTDNHFLKSFIKNFLFVLVGLCFVGWFFVEVIPIKSVVTLQLFRLLNFGKWICILFLAHLVVNLISQFKSQKNLSIALLFFISIYGFYKADWILILLLLTTIVAILFNRKNIAFVFCFLGLFGSVINLSELKSNQKVEFKSFLKLDEIPRENQEIASFLQENTAKESVVLAPHNFGFLRMYAKRAIVVDYKAFPFQNDAILEWHQRITSIYGNNKDKFETTYQNISKEKIQRLQKKYNFNYVVLYKNTATTIPVLFENNAFKIIRTN